MPAPALAVHRGTPHSPLAACLAGFAEPFSFAAGALAPVCLAAFLAFFLSCAMLLRPDSRGAVLTGVLYVKRRTKTNERTRENCDRNENAGSKDHAKMLGLEFENYKVRGASSTVRTHARFLTE